MGLLPLTAFALTPSLAWNGSSYGIIEAKTNDQTSVVLFNRVGFDGKKLQTDAAVATAQSAIRFPTLHWTGQTYMVFWTQSDGQGTLIHSRRIDGVGKPVTAVIRIHRSDVILASFESIMVEQNPHHFVLTWEETLSNNRSRSMLLRVDTAGAKLMEPVIVSETKTEARTPETPTLVAELGPTRERAQQASSYEPKAGGPPYPSQSSFTAQSLTSRPSPVAYNFLPLRTLPLSLPLVFKPETTEAAAQDAFYPFSPAPTFQKSTPRRETSSQPSTTAAGGVIQPTSTISTPTALGNEQITFSAGDLIRGSSPSVWQIGEDGKRHLFPDDFTFTSWSNQYEWVITASDEKIQRVPQGEPMLIYPGYAIVGFIADPNLYSVRRVGVLEKLASFAQAQQQYGKNWRTRIHIYPKELKAQYQFEFFSRKTPRAIAAKRAPKPTVKTQPKNLRARNVL